MSKIPTILGAFIVVVKNSCGVEPALIIVVLIVDEIAFLVFLSKYVVGLLLASTV